MDGETERQVEVDSKREETGINIEPERGYTVKPVLSGHLSKSQKSIPQ